MVLWPKSTSQTVNKANYLVAPLLKDVKGYIPPESSVLIQYLWYHQANMSDKNFEPLVNPVLIQRITWLVELFGKCLGKGVGVNKAKTETFALSFFASSSLKMPAPFNPTSGCKSTY